MTYPFSPHDWLKADSVTCHLDGSAPEEQEDQAIWGQGLSSHSQREQAKPGPGLPHGQPHSRPAPQPASQQICPIACPMACLSADLPTVCLSAGLPPQACRPGEYTRPWRVRRHQWKPSTQNWCTRMWTKLPTSPHRGTVQAREAH